MDCLVGVGLDTFVDDGDLDLVLVDHLADELVSNWNVDGERLQENVLFVLDYRDVPGADDQLRLTILPHDRHVLDELDNSLSHVVLHNRDQRITTKWIPDGRL